MFNLDYATMAFMLRVKKASLFSWDEDMVLSHYDELLAYRVNFIAEVAAQREARYRYTAHELGIPYETYRYFTDLVDRLEQRVTGLEERAL